jgi:hypothetical protein
MFHSKTLSNRPYQPLNRLEPFVNSRITSEPSVWSRIDEKLPKKVDTISARLFDPELMKNCAKKLMRFMHLCLVPN